MRIAWVQTEPGQGRQYQEEFRRVYAAEGMRAVWLAQTYDNPDSLFIVSLWDSLEAIRSWETSKEYRECVNPALNAFILGNYTVSVCEVTDARGATEPLK